ncbi:MAG: GTPase Era [Oscillospiraceae bacterium]|nr:GTPase Era [Oscillospiraceae bacterium]
MENLMKKKSDFKSGFAAIIGMPNVGKSTLLNALAGQKIAIISDKPQTTRNKILAIYTTETEQIIFTDTPGIHKPHNKLGEFMVNTANGSMKDTDVLIFVVDATKKIQDTEREIAKNIAKTGLPCVLVINKVDLVRKENLLPLIADYSCLHEFESIVPMSAKNKDGISLLVDEIREHIPPGPEFYDEDMVTDQPEKQIAAEIIREKMLWLLDKEVPHGIAIEITKMTERDKITNIYATIFCEKATHKGIIIGKNGEMLKKIGTLARGDIEKMLDKKVYLELWVKVKSDWRNNDFMIKNFGYAAE